MYSYDDEFTYTIDGELEYFTCIGNVKIKDNEYIIGENDYGQKKAFKVDEDEEELYLLNDDEEEYVFECFQRQSLDEDPDFGDLDDDYEYESKYIEGHNDDDDNDFDDFVDDNEKSNYPTFDYDDNDDKDIYDSDIDDDSFINDLLEDEEEE